MDFVSGHRDSSLNGAHYDWCYSEVRIYQVGARRGLHLEFGKPTLSKAELQAVKYTEDTVM